MLNLILIILSTLGAQAHADPASEVILKCQDLHYDDLTSLEITREADGRLMVTEKGDHQSESQRASREIAADSVTKGEIALSEWASGYVRTLHRDSSGWWISHKDECKEGITSATCFAP